MKKVALIVAAAATLAASAVVAPAPAEARGLVPGLARGLIAGAVIRWHRVKRVWLRAGYGYYGGYAPAYYGGYAPYWYGYRRVYRPAYAYYGGPRYYGGWHRGWRRSIGRPGRQDGAFLGNRE